MQTDDRYTVATVMHRDGILNPYNRPYLEAMCLEYIFMKNNAKLQGEHIAEHYVECEIASTEMTSTFA
ncbi:hypothetical protein TNCV_3887651 [Trichonephila clavipes]|nr:hypothetical protein TNCV_3887651 [Trichonephila clavipes]